MSYISDPYFSYKSCLGRLLKEYREHGRLIVAVDFDDTVFDFHGNGYHYDNVLDLLRDCRRLGFYIMLFTGSPEETWPRAVAYLNSHNVIVNAINENVIPLPFGNHGKPYFNVLLDDRAGLGQAFRILRDVVDIIFKEKDLEATA